MVRAKYALHERAFADRDAMLLVEQFFTANADWAFEGFGELNGRDELARFYAGVVRKSRVSICPISQAGGERIGWSLCDYAVEPDDGSGDPWTFRILFAWEERAGEWLVRAACGMKVG